jgi:hypothetical protein
MFRKYNIYKSSYIDYFSVLPYSGGGGEGVKKRVKFYFIIYELSLSE